MGAWPTIPQSRQVKVASSFEHLRDFIRKRMRMSHIYQPVMIKELLTSGGKSSIRNIAAAFLARDADPRHPVGQGLTRAKAMAQKTRDLFRLLLDP